MELLASNTLPFSFLSSKQLLSRPEPHPGAQRAPRCPYGFAWYQMVPNVSMRHTPELAGSPPTDAGSMLRESSLRFLGLEISAQAEGVERADSLSKQVAEPVEEAAGNGGDGRFAAVGGGLPPTAQRSGRYRAACGKSPSSTR